MHGSFFRVVAVRREVPEQARHGAGKVFLLAHVAGRVLLDEPIREVGSYTIAVRLHRDVNAEVQLEVEATA